MDVIRQKALEALGKDILPKLLQVLDELPLQNTDLEPETNSLLKEAYELIRIALAAQAPLQEEEASISDDDAKMLLAEMDTPASSKEAELDAAEAQMLAAMDGANSEAEMSDDEAQMLLADMDGSSPAASSSKAEMSDDEAKMLLADMDGSAPTAKDEIDDDEAKRLLALMDAPAPAVVQAAVIVEAPKPAVETKQEAPKASEIDEEEVSEIEEFGQNEFASDPEMVKDFINNSDELMNTLDEQILLLEQNPTEGSIIEEIFRAAHTLKGAAGMFAFRGIERVMHRMENYFDSVRKGKLAVNSQSIDIIFKTMDILRTLLDAVKAGQPSGVATVPIVKELNALCSGNLSKLQQSAPAKKAEPEVAAAKEDHEKPQKEDDGKAKAKKAEQSTIRVDLKRLDALVNLVGELVIDRTRFISVEEELINKGPSPRLAGRMSETVQLFGRHMNEVQDIIMNVRMVPIGNAFNKFPRVVRDLARSLNKEIDLVIEGEATELDKTIVEQIGDPLVHLIRNAVDHGVEMPEDRVKKGKSAKGTIHLIARQEGNQIAIEIRDDGKGMDPDILRRKGIERGLIREDAVLSEREIFSLIFESGFSTAQAVTNISGRGVGMDVVRKEISKLKGFIDIESKVGQGSVFSIKLPLTLAIVQSLIVRVKKEVFAIPLSTVVESIRIEPKEIQLVGGTEIIRRRNQVIPLFRLDDALVLSEKENDFWYGQEELEVATQPQDGRAERLFVVVVGQADRRFGIVVDNLINQQEMVIKPIGELMQDIPCVAGGAILGNGEVVLVLDLADLELMFRAKTRQQAA